MKLKHFGRGKSVDGRKNIAPFVVNRSVEAGREFTLGHRRRRVSRKTDRVLQKSLF